jgi:hypothetical protein
MKAAAIALLLIGLAAFIGMDSCHVSADKVIRSTDVLCQMFMPVAIGSIVLGLLLGLVDILKKVRAKRDKH